jgi:hypothetical protein
VQVCEGEGEEDHRVLGIDGVCSCVII